MKRSMAVLVTCLMAGSMLLFAAPASAQYDQVLHCSFTKVLAGQTATSNANGFNPGSNVVMGITNDGGSVPPGSPTTSAGELSGAALLLGLGTAVADANGQINFTFIVPDAAVLPAGKYFVTATGVASPGNGPRQLSCPFEIVTPVAVGPIAFTGSTTRPIAEVAIAMIAVGGLAVLFARRRMTGVAAETTVV